jgi:hypothetical protein
MEFKFRLGDVVKMAHGPRGEIIALVKTRHALLYRIRPEGSTPEYEAREASLWLVHCVPRWLRPGADVQWLGTGHHRIYTVVEVRHGNKYRPSVFVADRELIRPDGSSNGKERWASNCSPRDMRFWREVPKRGGVEPASGRRSLSKKNV